MVEPLTPQLLRARTVAIFEKVSAEHGPVEEIVFEVLTCDGCGTEVHLLRDGYPLGWTTVGDLGHGWFDLCAVCSAEDD